MKTKVYHCTHKNPNRKMGKMMEDSQDTNDKKYPIREIRRQPQCCASALLKCRVKPHCAGGDGEAEAGTGCRLPEEQFGNRSQA